MERKVKSCSFEVKNAKEDVIKVQKLYQISFLVKNSTFWGKDPNFKELFVTIGASQIACAWWEISNFYNDVVVFNKGEICFDANTAKKYCPTKKDPDINISDIQEVKFHSFMAVDLGYKYVEINGRL